MTRNKMEDYNLSIGERIHVGWVSTEQKQAEAMPIATLLSPISVKDDNMVLVPSDVETVNEDLAETEVDSLALNVEGPVVYKASRGKGMWDKKVRDNGKFLALHQKAKIGSTIELRNVMLNRTIKAKVIGRIPQNVYPDDIQVLLGPTAAKSLGVIDTKFSVEIRYTD